MLLCDSGTPPGEACSFSDKTSLGHTCIRKHRSPKSVPPSNHIKKEGLKKPQSWKN